MTKLGIVGLGNIGCVHLQNLRSLPGCTVSLAFDLDEHRLQKVCQEHGIRAAESYAALLADDIDAVVIATPTPFHRPLTELALEAGKHVFLEKPLASTLADSRAIVEAAERSRCAVQVGFCERFNPHFIEAHRAVRTGQLGVVRSALSSRVAPFSFGDPAWDLGVLDTAVHNFDLLLWLMQDRPTHVHAFGAKVYDESEIPNTVTTVLRFASGAVATDYISWAKDEAHPLHHCARARLFLQGSGGFLELNLDERPVRIHSRDGYKMADTVILGGAEYYACLKLQMESFLHSVRTGDAVAVSPRDAAQSEAVAIAAHESLRTGSPVEVSL